MAKSAACRKRKSEGGGGVYGWAFGLPEKFGSGISGFQKCYLKFALKNQYPTFRVPESSGFGFGFTRYARDPPICKPPPAGAPLLSPEVDAQQPPARVAPRHSGAAATRGGCAGGGGHRAVAWRRPARGGAVLGSRLGGGRWALPRWVWGRRRRGACNTPVLLSAKHELRFAN